MLMYSAASKADNLWQKQNAGPSYDSSNFMLVFCRFTKLQLQLKVGRRIYFVSTKLLSYINITVFVTLSAIAKLPCRVADTANLRRHACPEFSTETSICDMIYNRIKSTKLRELLTLQPLMGIK